MEKPKIDFSKFLNQKIIDELEKAVVDIFTDINANEDSKIGFGKSYNFEDFKDEVKIAKEFFRRNSLEKQFRFYQHEHVIQYVLDVPGFSKENISVDVNLQPGTEKSPVYLLSVNGDSKTHGVKKTKIQIKTIISNFVTEKDLQNSEFKVVDGLLTITIPYSLKTNEPAQKINIKSK